MQAATRLTTIISASAVLALTSPTLAGDLNPPATPISPTMKTLDEVEPRVIVNNLPGAVDAVCVISEPGSYVLAGDIQGQNGKHTIKITTTGRVTILGRGFALRGVPGSLDGIHCVATPGDPVGGINVSLEQIPGGIAIDDHDGDGITASTARRSDSPA